MKKIWKPLLAGIVIIAAAWLIVSGLAEKSTNSTGANAGDGSSLAAIDKALASGKPTLLLLRSET